MLFFVLKYLFLITCGAKLLNADWLRKRAFFLNHEGTFGNQECMITWCWLAEHACIKLVSRLKRIEKEFQKRVACEFDLNTVVLTYSNVKENEHVTKRSLLVEKPKDFPVKNVLIRSLKNVWAEKHGCSVARIIELQNFMAAKLKVNFFILFRVALIVLQVTLSAWKKQRKLCWQLKFSQWKGEFWIQEVIRARLVTCLCLLSIDEELYEVVSRRCKLRITGWIKDCLKSFVCKEITFSELNFLCFPYYFSRLFPCYC